MVLDHLVRLKDVGTDLATPGDLPLFSVLAIEFGALLVGFKLVDLGLEESHGQLGIASLAPLGLTGDDDPRGNVSEADSSLDLVNILPSLASGTVGVALDIGGIDLNRGILDLRRDVHASKGGVAPLG